MDSLSPEDMAPPFCIGQHEPNRKLPVTPLVVQKAHESNYDMLTTPVTTPYFHSRVLSQLSSHLSSAQAPTYDASGTLATTQSTLPLTISPLSIADTHLTPNESTSQLIGVTSTWIDLGSPDPLIANISRQVLMLEVAYAAFCGIGYLLIPGPKLHHGDMHSEGLVYYARAVQDALSTAPYMQVHIWLRMLDNPDLELDEMGDLAPLARTEYLHNIDGAPSGKVDPLGTWDAWDLIRRTCKYHGRLSVALSLPKQLPATFVQSRWHSEPVRLLTIDTTVFIKNQKGYPVLPKPHQALISKFMGLRSAPWILLCDVGPIPNLDEAHEDNASGVSGADFPSLSQAATSNKKHYDPTPHLSYMRNLQQRQSSRNAIERFGMGYQDYLQAPLQPLTVNLESITYEVFEKDPIKYEWYERAIAKALNDWAEQKKPTSDPKGRVVVAVVGAGRGPLVTRALRASAQTGVEIDMWAVEKNPNAFVLLQRHNQHSWGGKVSLVQSDMRSWKGPRRDGDAPVSHLELLQDADSLVPDSPGVEAVHTRVDILISELLGSFGDNELSPECLDGVTHLLNPVHGISIPASYSSHLTPISAPKLHADVMNQTYSNPAAPETPYVVMLHAIDFISTTQSTFPVDSPPGDTGSNVSSNRSRSSGHISPPLPVMELPTPLVQTAWSFSHPNRNIPAQPLSSTASNSHNIRQTRLTFPCQNRGVCHGLAGYFETVLYRDVELSTNPVTMDAKSANMISWFPIYFPLKTPLNVPDNGEIVITMYRQTDDRKVWYEWMVEVFSLEPPSSDPRQGQEYFRQPAHQSQGHGYRRVRVGISDLHSSIKDGCLM
ncbi:hypothetical protein MAP00_007734 [Monascus purpureus]|nr:hypothetical protein MAP00_007734 [Monascus purpureus]